MLCDCAYGMVKDILEINVSNDGHVRHFRVSSFPFKPAKINSTFTPNKTKLNQEQNENY